MKLVPFILLMFLALGLARSDSFDVKFTGGLDTTIDQVLMRGFWQDENKYGTYRLVSRNLGWEHTKSYLYLQWILTDDKAQELIEFKTLPITEFNDTDWRHLNEIKFVNDKFVISCELRMSSNNSQTIILKPGKPGKYKILFE